jgi:hypothetical protein
MDGADCSGVGPIEIKIPCAIKAQPRSRSTPHENHRLRYFKPGVTMETIKPYLREAVANVWRLWKVGIVRESYARADNVIE